MARRSETRGFAFMDPDRRRRIDSDGGWSPRSGRGRNYEEYDEDEGRRVGNRHRGQDWDEDYDDQDEYEDAGHGDEDDYDEDEDGSRGRRYSSRGRGSSGRRSNTSRRGFGSMEAEQRRRIARLGGQATARSHGREFYEDIGRPNFIRRLVAGVDVRGGTKRTMKTTTDVVVLQEDIRHHLIVAPVVLEEEDLRQCLANK